MKESSFGSRGERLRILSPFCNAHVKHGRYIAYIYANIPSAALTSYESPECLHHGLFKAAGSASL